MREHRYYVYIMASMSGTIYVGITNNLIRRAYEHKSDLAQGFTQRYKCHKLIYFEETSDVISAINREKQIKGLNRQKKTDLIRSMNPHWKDLYSAIV